MRRVNPKVYTKDYYLTDCTGYVEFKKSYGKLLEPRFIELIKYFSIKSGMRVLDVGCGRGEMVFYAAKHGAEGIGIDYSKDSIELARVAQKKQSKQIQNKTEFIHMDAKKLKFSENYFDLIIMTDVVEHLYPEELELAFKEIKRVLKPNGQLIIHTAPNKLFNDIFYKFYCYPVSSILTGLWNILNKSKYPNIVSPKEIRTDSHLIMHINEPTYFSLSNLFNKYGFKGNLHSSNVTVRKPIFGIKDIIFNFFVFFDPISRIYPFNIYCGSDFVCVLINKK